MDDNKDLWDGYNRDRTTANRNLLVEAYMPLLEAIAKAAFLRHQFHQEFAALVSAGAEGLIRAVERYDAALGFQFCTYATPRIRGAILDWLREIDDLPRQLRQRVNAGKAVAPQMLAFSYKRVPGPRDTYDMFDTLDPADPGQPDPSHAMQIRDMVAAAMLPLDAKRRAVIQLYDLDGLTMKAAAKVIGVTEGRVSQCHTDTMNYLRRHWAPHHA